MKAIKKIIVLLILLQALSIQAQDVFSPKAFISITTTFGRHNIQFVDFANSSGLSFGFNVNLGIYDISSES